MHRGSGGIATTGRSTKSRIGRCRIKKATHASHCVHIAKTVSGAAIIFCSLCGAYGSQKAIKLRQACEPQDEAKRQAQWASIMIKRRHLASKEASLLEASLLEASLLEASILEVAPEQCLRVDTGCLAKEPKD